MSCWTRPRKTPLFLIGSSRSISFVCATYTSAGPRHDLNIPSLPISNTHPTVPSLCKRGLTVTFLSLRGTSFQNHGKPSPFRTNPSRVTLRMKCERLSTECDQGTQPRPRRQSCSLGRDWTRSEVSPSSGSEVRVGRSQSRQDVDARVVRNPPGPVKSICSDTPNLTTLSLTRTCVTELFSILTPSPSLPPTYLADLFDSYVTPEPCTPCPALKVLEMRHPVWIASRHCREALALAKARTYGEVPFARVFFCSSSVPKSTALGMSLYVGNIDTQKSNGCE